MIDWIGRTFAPQNNASPTSNLSQAASSGRPTAVRRCPFLTSSLAFFWCTRSAEGLSAGQIGADFHLRHFLDTGSAELCPIPNHGGTSAPSPHLMHLMAPSDAGVWHQPISLQPEASCAVRAAGSSAWPPITPSAVAVCVAALELMLLQVAGCDSAAC